MQEAPREKRAFDVEPSQRRYRLRLARYPAQVEALSARLDGTGERPHILDAGCGKGRLPLYWRRFGRGQPTFVGVDVSPRRLARAAEAGYALLLRGDLSAPWPLQDARFDAAVIEQVLEHFDDDVVDHALAEAVRVVRPGGLVLVGVPLFTRTRLALRPLWEPLHDFLRRQSGRPHETHLQHFTLAALRARLERHGLEVETVAGVRVLSLPRNWLEDRHAWYRFQRWLGRRFPALCSEVTVVARTPAKPETERRTAPWTEEPPLRRAAAS